MKKLITYIIFLIIFCIVVPPCLASKKGEMTDPNWVRQRYKTGNYYAALSVKFTQISAGMNHTCAIAATGKLYCWGTNIQGQLGTNSTISSDVPVLIYDPYTASQTGLLGGESVTSVSVGTNNTCAINSTGRLYCWGYNFHGEVGIGSKTLSKIPLLVYDPRTSSQTGLLGDEFVASVSVGSENVCAINVTGVLYCWGNNGYGQLGNKTTTQSLIPTLVYDDSKDMDSGTLGGESVASVSAGYHTCAINVTGNLYCWGRNTSGELGINSTTNSSQPVLIGSDFSGLLNGRTVLSVSTGYNHTCAVNSENKLYCWGYNGHGEIGINSTTTSKIPVLIYDSSTSSQTGLLNGEIVTSVSAGSYHTCAISNSGKLFCWGENNDEDYRGQLGTNTTTSSKKPVLIYDSHTESQSGFILGQKVTSVSTGSSYTCAINSVDYLYCWGKNSNGVLGIGISGSNINVPAKIFDSDTSSHTGSLGHESVWKCSAGAYHTCGINSFGKLYCWGNNTSGQLGINSYIDSRIPVSIYDSSAAKQTGLLQDMLVMNVSSGSTHACAIDETGKLYCWGYNDDGQLGNNSYSLSSVPVLVYDPSTSSQTGFLGGKGVTGISIGTYHTCAIDNSGKLYCWGGNGYGQLGINSKVNSSVPVLVYDPSTSSQTGLLGGETVTSISLGAHFTCAINNSGKLYCWGYNNYGQLGINSKTESVVPVLVYDPDTSSQTGLLGGNGITGISTGDYHTCGINTLGKLYCWGNNGSGRLGINTTVSSDLPVLVYDPSTSSQTGFLGENSVIGVSAGFMHTCAFTSTKLYCWGNNEYRELGINSSEDYVKKPTSIYDSSTSSQTGLIDGEKVIGVFTGSYHSCAINNSNKLFCWGENNGDNFLGVAPLTVPQQVLVQGESVPTGDEICGDGIDNDEDGATDEVDCICDDPGEILNDTCNKGVGNCLNSGYYECNISTGEINCNAVAGSPIAITCSNIELGQDKNCDGESDSVTDIATYGNSCTAVSKGKGVCATTAGHKGCVGSSLVCVNDFGESGDISKSEEEICGDGLDNDCDGYIDEECSIPVPVTCANLDPSSDLNLDGKLDSVSDISNYGDICSDAVSKGKGVCATTAGHKGCVGSSLVCVNDFGESGDTSKSEEEVCEDGLDNDCDGYIDEECETPTPEVTPTPTPTPEDTPTPKPTPDFTSTPKPTLQPIYDDCHIDANLNGIMDCYDPDIEPSEEANPKTVPAPAFFMPVTGKKITFFMQKFKAPNLGGKKSKKAKIKYIVQIKFKPAGKLRASGVGQLSQSKKGTVIKRTVKKNKFVINRAKPGTYTTKYRAIIPNGKKAKQTKWSGKSSVTVPKKK